MKKRIVPLLLVVAMLFTMLIGCGKDASDDSSKTPDSGAAVGSDAGDAGDDAGDADELEPVTLQYWIIGSGQQKDSEEVWAHFNELLAEHVPNTTVEFTVLADDYNERFMQAMGAEETIDMAWMGWFSNVQDEVNKGTMLQLDDLLAEYGSNIVDALTESTIDVHRSLDGGIYFLPAWQGLVGNRSGFRLPVALLEKAGGADFQAEWQQVMYDNCYSFTVDAKQAIYEKVEAYMAACFADIPGSYGFNPALEFQPRIANLGIKTWGDYAYVEYGDDSFTVKPLVASDVYKDYYATMADWFTKGYIRADVASADLNDVELVEDGSGYLFGIHDNLVDDDAVNVTKRSGYPMEVVFCTPAPEYYLGFETGTILPYTCSNPERAMMVLDFLYSEEGAEAYQCFVYGLEGKHWTDNGDGTITTLGGDGQGSSDWDYGNWKWTLGTCMNSLVTQADTAGYYEGLREMETKAYAHPLLNFTFDNTNVATIMNQLDTVIAEYKTSLNYGYLGENWEARYNEYVAKLEEAGLNDYIAELQTQLNAYVAERNATWGDYDPNN